MAIQQPTAPQMEHNAASGLSEGSIGIPLGLFMAGVFYAAVCTFPHPWMQQYFLGHAVCVGATLLFAIAGGILIVKSLRVTAERRLGAALRDSELAYKPTAKGSSSDQWSHDYDAGRVAKAWLQSLTELPATARRSRLVSRLVELLERQSNRVSTRHLSADLREISVREAVSADDSLQLIRIIVGVIPMLGFFGTVVGITQTLGGLNVSNDTAAIEQLKVGLSVALDSTAVGLMLSVLVIFFQYPVKHAEQQLLGEIDRRVSSLLFSKLPADDAADKPAAHIAQLCEGIRVAVGESLASQTKLWRQTIDEAHVHWQQITEAHGQRSGEVSAVVEQRELRMRRGA